MRLLLDTHILIWASLNKLPAAAERYVADRSNTPVFSSASIWEVVIKSGLGRPDFKIDPAMLCNGLIRAGYEELHVTSRQTLFVAALPPLHKDPFDRILLAQSAYEGIPLLTADKTIASYPGSIIYVG